MILMQINHLLKSFGATVLFQDIQIEVKSKDRIAIVGRNGAGKSTLLKIMTGEIPYDEGEIYQPKNMQIGYLAQHNDVHSTKTIWEEMLTVFAHLQTEEKELAAFTVKIEKMSEQGTYDEKLLHEYSTRQDQFADAGGYRYESDVKGVLIGLGFSEDDFGLYVGDLSGGQKTRLALGKLLLKQPDLLILDEPTNHLDIATLTWLENYLTNYPGAIVIVSHDRYFLDKIVNIVYEIAHKHTTKYHGSYSRFLEQKEQNYERDVKQFEKQQQEIKEMEDFVQRNIARASTTKRAQSRRKQLDKMTKLDRPLGNEAGASFSFEVTKTSGNDVMHVVDYSFTHEGEIDALFSGVNLTVHRGERIALIGENGIGKTTFLKGLLEDHPSIKAGSNVQIGYYAQEQEKLTDANTVLDEVWDDFPDKPEQEIRTILGNFLFSGEDVLKHIHTLSGGEKARVALAKLMLLKANFLLLDEPTNHLDVMSKEVLENALQYYEGTVLFVSHDRYFINKIADKIAELTAKALTIYLGDYDYYTEKKLEEAEIKRLESDQAPRKQEAKQVNVSFAEQKRLQSEQRKRERQIEQIEVDIEHSEEKINQLETDMTKPEVFQDHEKLLELTNETDALKAKVEQLMEEWTILHS